MPHCLPKKLLPVARMKRVMKREMPPYAAFHLSLHCLPKKLLPVARMRRVMDKAPNIVHLSILTSVGYNKKETN